jgi:uncharacterized membrane protein YdbT with pleckstrin-like domain
MSYIDRNLISGEQILFRTRKHRIIFFFPVVLTLVAVYFTNYMHGNAILIKMEWVPWFVALVFWCQVGLQYFASEYAVTNKRVMMREGFFVRHANEIRLSAISQVNVVQSLLGQLLNYGVVSINAFGAYDSYPLINQPFEFQKQVNQQLDTLVK